MGTFAAECAGREGDPSGQEHARPIPVLTTENTTKYKRTGKHKVYLPGYHENNSYLTESDGITKVYSPPQTSY